MKQGFLKMNNIHKRFPGVYAIKGVNLEVHGGEVHGLLGENGAGKSTLMKVLGGVHAPDEGEIIVNGEKLSALNPRAASEKGIVFVHQEINLAESLTVAENLFLGRLPYKNKKLSIVDHDKLHRDAKKIIDMMGISLETEDIVSTLSAAQKQMLEIGKAISQNAKILIFDEPTTSLSDKDVDILFSIINKLKAQEVAIIYISHRLNEVFEICDRATVMRDGEYIGLCDMKTVSRDELIKMMVGRELKQLFPKENAKIGQVVLEVNDLKDLLGKVKGVSFHAKKGEVLGFSGLVGAGRTETMRLLFGADKKLSGEIRVNGKTVNISSPKDAVHNNICLLTEDRKKEGLCMELSIENNITITGMKSFVLNHSELQKISKNYVEKLQIKAPNIEALAGNLSGGNQQKVIIGKWLNTDTQIFVFDEPTKGIDVGTKNDIYRMINQLVASGKTVIMISSELPEIMGMSDRIYVMCEGRITGELEREDFSQERIMHLSMLGGSHE